jgi:ABC-type sugar transport system substrate-binding protein
MAACGGEAGADDLRIAWFGATPDNAYDGAILSGAREAVMAAEGEVVPFYSQFDPMVQLEQCRGAVESGEFDALIILAASAEGIVPCVSEAEAAGIPVVAADLPIGPDAATLEPQVPGQVGAVLIPSSSYGPALAEVVLAGCEGLDPCRVVYIAGLFAFAIDAVALDELDALALAHPNIQIVARGESSYDPEIARQIVQDALVDTPTLEMIVGSGDQMARGAEEALAAAKVPAGQVKLVGAGASAYAVDAVRAGTWYATFLALPFDEGQLAGEMAVQAVRGEAIADPGVDPVAHRGLPAFMTADNIEMFADFEPQWDG